MKAKRSGKTSSPDFPWEAVFFDFDGVLIESLKVKDEAFEKIFLSERPAHRRAIMVYHRREGGMSRWLKFNHIYRKILKRPLTRSESAQLGRRFSMLVEDQVARQPLVKGARELLRFLSSRTCLFLVSGAPGSELRRLARRLRLVSFFKGGVHGYPPDKTGILRKLLAKGWSPRRSLMVGDSRNDQEAARRCRVSFVARRSRRGDWVRERGPMVKDMLDLRRWMERAIQDQENGRGK